MAQEKVQKNPHVEDVSYTHPARANQSPARLVRYLTRRPESKSDPGPESTWSALPEEQVYGDPEAFKSAANERTRELRAEYDKSGKDLSRVKADWATSYLHVVISPANRYEMEPGDWRELIEPWNRDERGREAPYFAAVHEDGKEGPHLHIAVVRNKYRPEELESVRQRTRQMSEMLHPMPEPERSQEPDQEQSQEQNPEPDQDQQPSPELEQEQEYD